MPLKRKTPLRANPETTKAWKARSRKNLPQRSKRRATQERDYSAERRAFLEAHPVCPVTGERTVHIHHSAHREGGWLNLKRYWIAVSHRGHEIIHREQEWARSVGLLIRVNAVFNWHLESLVDEGIDTERPMFYETWNGRTLTPP